MFQKAERRKTRLRMTIDGPAGSGKTFTALRFAHELANGGKIALLDTERGSASKYAGEAPDGKVWEFDVAELSQFSPDRYTEAIQAAGRFGYAVLVIDSLSHAWEGVGGALEMKQKAGDAWRDWRTVTPVHNRMIDAILQSPCHIITTMRSRMEYVQELDPATGKLVVRKIGMAPVQRPGAEYEFDLVCDIDTQHVMSVSKSRCSAVDGMIVDKPGPAFMRVVQEWLTSGSPSAERAPEPVFEKAAVIEAAPVAAPQLTLDDLVGLYGVEAVLAGNGGMIPGTQEEIDKLVLSLAGMAA